MRSIICCLLIVGLGGCSASRATRRARGQTKVACKSLKDCKEREGALNGQMANLRNDVVQAHQQNEMAQAKLRNLNDSAEQARQRAAAAESNLLAMSTEVANAQGLTQEALQQAIALQRDLDRAQDQNRTLRRLAVTPQPPAPPYVEPAPVAPVLMGPSKEALAFQTDLTTGLRRQGVNDLPVEVRRDEYGERVAVVLPDAFASGKADLHQNKRAVQAIVGLGRLIQESYPHASVLVEGHTDSDPIVHSSWGTNERLSLERAGAVRQLLASTGVNGSSVSTQGLGAARPLDPGSSREAKSRNRRVEIYIKPNA